MVEKSSIDPQDPLEVDQTGDDRLVVGPEFGEHLESVAAEITAEMDAPTDAHLNVQVPPDFAIDTLLADPLYEQRFYNESLDAKNEVKGLFLPLRRSLIGKTKEIDYKSESLFFQFFHEFGLRIRREYAKGIRKTLGPTVGPAFLRAVSKWGDGKSKREKDPEVLGLKKAVMEFTGYQAAEADKLQQVKPLMRAETVRKLIEFNQQFINDLLDQCNDWLDRCKEPRINFDDVLCFRGMTFGEELFDKQQSVLYQPREYLTSFSVASSVADQFGTMKAEDAPGQSVIVTYPLMDALKRTLFFTPLCPGMTAFQYEVGLAPPVTKLYAHYAGSINGVDYYMMSHMKHMEMDSQFEGRGPDKD
jgi:hypothetical protein